MTPEATVDARDLRCPLPVLRARKALLALPPGGRLRILTTDPMALIDLPHFCAGAGHRIVAQSTEDGAEVFVIERGPASG